MKHKTVLITGATGFIGKHLLHELCKPMYEKRYRILCFVRKAIDARSIVGALNDRNSVFRATKHVDYVVHLAGETKSSNKKLNYAANVIGTRNFVEACERNGVRKFVFCGTVNADLKQRGVYGETKRQAEAMVKGSRLDYVVLKFNMVYGEGDNNLSKTIRLVKKIPILPIIGGGEGKIQPVYVEDVVYAIVRCLKIKKLKEKTYSLAGPHPMTFNEYLDTILDVLSLKRMKIHIPVPFMRALVMVCGGIFRNVITPEIVNSITQDKNVDIRPAQRDLHFKPRDFKAMLCYMNRGN